MCFAKVVHALQNNKVLNILQNVKLFNLWHPGYFTIVNEVVFLSNMELKINWTVDYALKSQSIKKVFDGTVRLPETSTGISRRVAICQCKRCGHVVGLSFVNTKVSDLGD